MAKININASPDEIQQVVSSIAPPQIPSVPLPPPPPMPVPAQAGYKAFASDPINQSAISKHITPPNTSILPPAPIPAAPPAWNPPQSSPIPAAVAAPQPWTPPASTPSSTILPPGMTPPSQPSQMASVNPPKPQMASVNPPQVAQAPPPSLYGNAVPTVDSPQSSAMLAQPMGQKIAPLTVNPYGTPTQAEWAAANPSLQAQQQFGGGWKKNLANIITASALGAAGGLKGNPSAGAEWVAQGMARDAQVPEVNNQRYRAAVVQPEIDAIKAQEAAATVAHTQAQTGDIGAKRQQEYAKLGLKETANPDGTTSLAVDPDSPVTKANADKDAKLRTQTQLLSAQIDSTKAQKELRDAQTAYNQAKTDPNTPFFKQVSQRLAIAQQNANAAGQRAKAYWGNYLQHSQNLGLDGQVLPGAPLITDNSGNQTAVGSTNAAQAVKGQSNVARFNDVGGSLDSLDSSLQALHKTGGALNSPAVLQALQDNQTPLNQWIQSKAAQSLSPQERDAVIKVKNAREQIMALRASVGGGVSDAQINRLVSQVPDGTSPDYDYSKRQIDTLRQSIARLTPGVTTANKGLTVHGQGKPNNMVPPSQGGNDMITVQIPGQAPGQIHASQKAAFLAKYPNAKVN